MAALTLLVDLGNTRFKWAACVAGVLSEPSYRLRGGAREVAELVRAWLVFRPSRIVVASVLDEAFEHALEAEVAGELGICVEWVRVPATGHGIQVAYRDPTRLGVDRFVAMVGAREHRGRPRAVVDCGTAVTIDAVDEAGRHRGGLIFPGLGLMRQALARGTAGIDVAGQRQALGLFGCDTETAISAGVARAAAAAIDRICSDMDRALGGETVRILTGGDADRLSPLLRGRYRHDPVLTLKGLAIIACPDHPDA